MPTSLQGFKSHPLYILQRDLRREEIVHPAVVIGHFRGEPVYSRNNVIELKAAENWMKSNGREIKEGEQPMKWVKMRAVTTARKRAIELAKMDGGDEAQQGLYAHWQTKVYVPPPVVDVSTTRSYFSSAYLRHRYRVKYQRTISATSTCTHPRCYLVGPSIFHVCCRSCVFRSRILTNICDIDKGIAKVARKLEIDYAEAVVRPPGDIS